MMDNADILRAARAMRGLLASRYPELTSQQMSLEHMQSLWVPTPIQLRHLMFECESIELLAREGTQTKREKAMRWLADVGGVMRSEAHLVSVEDLRYIFTPASDRTL